MGTGYTILDGISRAYNKLVFMPALRRSLASCGENVMIGRRSEIAGEGNISLGHDVYLGPGATLLTTRARIVMGNYVMSGPNLTVITGDHRIDMLDRPMMSLTDDDKLSENDRDVVIGNDVWIGGNVTILKGVHVANHCVLAAGAVVTKNVGPEYSIWGGVPARMLSMRPGADKLQGGGVDGA